MSMVDGLGPDCPGLVGTLTEYRHIDVEGWIRDDGAAHAAVVATATVTLAPEGGGTSYAGGYVERQTGQFTGYGDDDRVVTAVTHGVLTGTDGSTYRISEVSHLAIDGTGRPTVWFDRLSCEPAK